MFSHSNIAEVWNDRNGICTIISDDGFLDSGLLLNELCKKTQLHATIAGTVCFIEPNLKIWQNIEREGYLELVNHSYSHIPMNSFSKRTDEQAQLRHEILDAKAFYEEHFSTPAFTYVPPTMISLSQEIDSSRRMESLRCVAVLTGITLFLQSTERRSSTG